MLCEEMRENLDRVKAEYPDKFASLERVFGNIHPGDRIFISTGCGEPQYLVAELIKYVESNPKAFFDTEILHVWTLGVAPYTQPKFKANFRHNSFFIGNNTREAVNKGMADYTPIFLSEVPALFERKFIPVDVALIQTSMPDGHGFMSLGVSVDIVKAAVDNAGIVIAQVNANMPRVHGDGFINAKDVDFIVPLDEEVLTYTAEASGDIAHRIGKYVSQIVEDGDTIQVGYGSLPNAVLAALGGKKHLGVHTELISDGIVELMQKGVVDNSRKTIGRGKSVATFCMGKTSTYDYIHDNPAVEFRSIRHTNNPLVIAQHDNMVAINSALEIDLTGQATAESLGKTFYSGIGGQADFMRGAVLANGGKTILALQSTADDESASRIVPFLKEGAGATLIRGDIHYVITEYGIAYLHGKNIRERAMALIAIAHPKFRGELIKQAKACGMIYKDQAFVPGKRGEYPEHLETFRTTSAGLTVFMRPVKMSDESLLKDLFYSLSERSLYRRFISTRKDMPHERLQEFVIIDYTKRTTILATVSDGERETVVGMGEYSVEETSHTAEVAFVVKDDYQGKGVGTELLDYLIYLSKRQGLLGFTAEVLAENSAMLHLFEKAGFDIEKRGSGGVYELKLPFK
jgi:acyl-CoA hydrolase/RimJ/RimL family protein N-acetyltransferase